MSRITPSNRRLSPRKSKAKGMMAEIENFFQQLSDKLTIQLWYMDFMLEGKRKVGAFTPEEQVALHEIKLKLFRQEYRDKLVNEGKVTMDIFLHYEVVIALQDIDYLITVKPYKVSLVEEATLCKVTIFASEGLRELDKEQGNISGQS